MKPFMDKDFLLTTDTAKRLYHDYASKMPICDYHCHIDPKDIWEDRRFSNITELWLGGDHYKWRIMRSNGVPEEEITGSAPARVKFQRFAEALPRAIGNPMYHWCHLELKNYFGYEGILNGDTAQAVWELTEKKLSEPGFSARNLIKNSNVAMVGTTDDPCSDLQYHAKLSGSDFPVKVLPSFRPDPAVNIHKPGFKEYIAKLAATCGMEIKTVSDVCAALTSRIAFFDKHGCRASDHGLDQIIHREATQEQLDAILAKALSGQAVTREEAEAYQTAVVLHCGREYARLGWAMQLHFGAVRNPNSRMFAKMGPDVGFDCIGVTDSCAAAYRLMDTWERDGKLPKTILYSLNPGDDQWLDTLLGAFQGTELPGKIQHGSAWWFNDNKVGMENQMISLANLGILGNFIGMLTDSRSLLSYARHEYFRRILCQLIGTWVENGEYPQDMACLGALVEDISFNNAKRYFDL